MCHLALWKYRYVFARPATCLLISRAFQDGGIEPEQSEIFAIVSVAASPEVSVQFPFSCDVQVSSALPSSLNLQAIYGCMFLFLHSKEVSRTEISRN